MATAWSRLKCINQKANGLTGGACFLAPSPVVCYSNSLEDGERLPHPSKLEEIMADGNFSDAVAYLVVGVPDAKPRTVRVNITLPEMTLKQIDAAAKRRGMSRSSFLVHAAQNAIQSNHTEASV
jgi:HicB_like antitoxin of bacterial toxin-antitoxin system